MNNNFFIGKRSLFQNGRKFDELLEISLKMIEKYLIIAI